MAGIEPAPPTWPASMPPQHLIWKNVCFGQYEALSGNASAFGQFRNNRMGVAPTGFEPAMLWLKARGLDRLPTAP